MASLDPRPSPSAYRRFLAERAADLHFISRQSRGEASLKDLEQEAWLTAIEVASDRGSPVDLSRPEDQKEVLTWLYSKFVKFTEKKVRNAFTLHRHKDDETGRDWDHAPLSSDPLHILLKREEHAERSDFATRFGYSQATVYAFLVVRFGRADAAAYLVISDGSFKQRLTRAVEHVRVQPSLFDRTESIVPSASVPNSYRGPGNLALFGADLRSARANSAFG